MSTSPEQAGNNRKTNKKILKFGCLPILGIIVLIVIIAAIAGGGSDDKTTATADKPSTAATTRAPEPSKTASAAPAHKPTTHPKPTHKARPKTVTFKVWGTAPAGALGGLDITYGSDTDSRKGTFTNGTFTATLPLDNDAMYYNVTAQLQGSGDINCSVTVDGHTKKGHASGGYNICDAQLSGGIFGGWE